MPEGGRVSTSTLSEIGRGIMDLGLGEEEVSFTWLRCCDCDRRLNSFVV